MEQCKPEPAGSKDCRPPVWQHGHGDTALAPDRLDGQLPALLEPILPAQPGWEQLMRASTEIALGKKRGAFQLPAGLPPPPPGFQVRSSLHCPECRSSGAQRAKSPRAAQPWDYVQTPLICSNFHHTVTKGAQRMLWGLLFNYLPLQDQGRGVVPLVSAAKHLYSTYAIRVFQPFVPHVFLPPCTERAGAAACPAQKNEFPLPRKHQGCSSHLFRGSTA